MFDLLKRLGTRIVGRTPMKAILPRPSAVDDPDLATLARMSRPNVDRRLLTPPKKNEDAITTDMLGPDRKLRKKEKPDAGKASE